MKKTFLIHLFCSFSFLSLAQNKTFKAFLSIKSIDNQNVTDDVLGFGRDSLSYKFTGLISPTFTYSKMRPSGKRFVEYQLSNLKAQKTDDVTFLISDSETLIPRAGGEIANFSLALAYTENFLLTSQKNKFAAWLGGGIQSHAEYTRLKPKTSISFPKTIFSNTFNLLLIPRLTYQLNKKIMFDFHIPLVINSLEIAYNNSQNPIKPISEQRQIDFIYDWRPTLSEIRLGFGMFF